MLAHLSYHWLLTFACAGGSIRVPSHCCGLYGLRPTTRRLPYSGVSNVMKGFEGMESTIGPMARSLDSLNVFMDAVIGAEPWLFDAKTVERVHKSSLPCRDRC